MIYLNFFLWFASMLSLGFGIAMSVAIWRDRPAAVAASATPAYRRSSALLERRSVDGRRRDLEPFAQATDPIVAQRLAALGVAR